MLVSYALSYKTEQIVWHILSYEGNKFKRYCNIARMNKLCLMISEGRKKSHKHLHLFEIYRISEKRYICVIYQL